MELIEKLHEEISKLQQNEKELRDRLNGLQDFIENAAIPLHWVNGSGVIIWANQAELEMTGYQREEYIGKHISNFHSDPKVIENMLTRLIARETLTNFPARLRAKDGRLIHVLINSNVRWDGDKFIHTRCFTRDISDLKKSEQEKIALINDLNEKNQRLSKEVRELKRRHQD